MTTPNRSRVPCTLMDRKSHQYAICFIPKTVGQYSVSVNLYGQNIRNSPLVIEVSGKNTTGSKVLHHSSLSRIQATLDEAARPPRTKLSSIGNIVDHSKNTSAKELSRKSDSSYEPSCIVKKVNSNVAKEKETQTENLLIESRLKSCYNSMGILSISYDSSEGGKNTEKNDLLQDGGLKTCCNSSCPMSNSFSSSTEVKDTLNLNSLQYHGMNNVAVPLGTESNELQKTAAFSDDTSTASADAKMSTPKSGQGAKLKSNISTMKEYNTLDQQAGDPQNVSSQAFISCPDEVPVETIEIDCENLNKVKNYTPEKQTTSPYEDRCGFDLNAEDESLWNTVKNLSSKFNAKPKKSNGQTEKARSSVLNGSAAATTEVPTFNQSTKENALEERRKRKRDSFSIDDTDSNNVDEDSCGNMQVQDKEERGESFTIRD